MRFKETGGKKVERTDGWVMSGDVRDPKAVSRSNKMPPGDMLGEDAKDMEMTHSLTDTFPEEALPRGVFSREMDPCGPMYNGDEQTTNRSNYSQNRSGWYDDTIGFVERNNYKDRI